MLTRKSLALFLWGDEGDGQKKELQIIIESIEYMWCYWGVKKRENDSDIAMI